MTRVICCCIFLFLVGEASNGRAASDGRCVITSGRAHPGVVEVAVTAGYAPVDGSDVNGATRLSAACTRAAIAVGPEAVRVARQQLSKVPIVATMVWGLEAQLDDGTDLYGVSSSPDPALVYRTLTALDSKIRRVGVVYDPSVSGRYVELATRLAEIGDIELVALQAKTLSAAIRAFERFRKEIPIDALWFLPDRTVTREATVTQALKIAGWKRIAVVGLSRGYVASGALFAYVPEEISQGRLAVEMAERILAGTQRSRVIYSPESALIIRQRTLDVLGLRLPEALRQRAREIIE